MIHQAYQRRGTFHYGIVPPHILEAIARNGTEEQRAVAAAALAADAQIRTNRAALMPAQMQAMSLAAPEVGAANKNRLIYTAARKSRLPGKLLRSEGQDPNKDVAVNEAYDGLGATYDLYCDIYGRNSIDDHGMNMVGSVHYKRKYDNAFFDGTQMVFGDGDGLYFNRFTIDLDVIGHELTHGVTATTANLDYQDQPGALNESVSDVFGSLVKQRTLGQTADQADWLIGAHLFTAQVHGIALRSMKAPGTAYDDPVIGKDPQPDNMSHYVAGGDVHVNSGIPNKAFYLVAIALGGNAWERSGNIWYQTLLDSRLSAAAQFQDFANLTADNANKLYGPTVKASIVQAWQGVGIEVPA